MRFIISIFVLILTHGAWAGHATLEQPAAVSSPHPTIADDHEKKECEGQILTDDEIKAILKKAYQPFIRTLARPVDFFHYGYRTPRYPKGLPPESTTRVRPYPQPAPRTTTLDLSI